MAKYNTEDIRQICKKYHKTVDPGFEYKSSNDKIPITCDRCGYRYSILLRNIISGGYGNGYKTGCKNCIKRKKISYPSSLKKMKKDFEFESHEFINIEGDFNKNCYINLICPNGHKYKVRKDYWYEGSRCPFCKKLEKDPSTDIRLYKFHSGKDITMCDIKEVAHDNGFRLLSVGKYDGDSDNKLNFECIHRGHKIKLSLNDLRNGKGCYKCIEEDLFEKIRKDFNCNNYTLLTNLEKEYKDKHTPLECIHNECGYKFETNWERFDYHKNRCPKCQSIISGRKRSGLNSALWKNYSEEDIKSQNNYRDNVTQLTELNYKKYKNIINPYNLNRKRGQFNLDHIYSVMDGFKNNVLPEIISHPYNLQMLSENINISKSDRSDISLEELHNRHDRWKREI